MRLPLIALTLLIAGCQAPSPYSASSLNHEPGRYADFADYMIATDPELTKDARRVGANSAQTHCVAEDVGTKIYQSDYVRLSDAVSGKRTLTRQEEEWAWGKFQVAARDKAAMKQILENAWAKCMA